MINHLFKLVAASRGFACCSTVFFVSASQWRIYWPGVVVYNLTPLGDSR